MPAKVSRDKERFPALASTSTPFVAIVPSMDPSKTEVCTFSPSTWRVDTVLTLLFKSCSVPAAITKVPSFFLLGSVVLCFFLTPPPQYLAIVLPYTLQPTFLFLSSEESFSKIIFIVSRGSRPIVYLLRNMCKLCILVPVAISPFIYSSCLFRKFTPCGILCLAILQGSQCRHYLLSILLRLSLSWLSFQGSFRIFYSCRRNSLY